jgi:acyl carrier protein
MDGVHVLWGAEHGRSVVTDIAAEVRDILVFHLGSEEATLTDNAKLIEDLGADSLDVVEVVMSFEERFDIDIPNHRATEFVTVGDAIAFIKAHIAADRMPLWPSVGLPQPVVRAAS